MNARLILTTLFAVVCSGQIALADDTRCVVSKDMMDANFSLDQATVSIQPDGTIVSCNYKSNNAGSLGVGGVGFAAKCPISKMIRFPGYVLPSSDAYRARSVAATVLSDGTSQAEVIVQNIVDGGAHEITILAYCN